MTLGIQGQSEESHREGEQSGSSRVICLHGKVVLSQLLLTLSFYQLAGKLQFASIVGKNKLCLFYLLRLVLIARKSPATQVEA